MESSRAAPVFVTMVLLLLVAGGYLGSYYALVQRGAITVDQIEIVFLPDYRWGGAVIGTILYPARQFDRRIRPEYWGAQVDVVQ